jgi:hypothetical protein
MTFRCDRCWWSALGEGDEVGVAEDLAAGFPEVTAIPHEAVTASGLSQIGLQGSRYLYLPCDLLRRSSPSHSCHSVLGRPFACETNPSRSATHHL